MRTLKISILLLAIMATSVAGKASQVNEKLSMKYAADTYVNALCHGQVKDIAAIFDNDAKFTSTRGQNIANFTKGDILTSLRSNKGIEQNCAVTSSVLEALPDQVIMKINMKYDAFTRVDIVTMLQTRAGWKITNVATTYQ